GEQQHEGHNHDVAAAVIDEDIEHQLTVYVIGHFAAAVGVDNQDDIGDLHRCRALPECVHRRMLEQPQLVRRGGAALGGEAADGFERRQVCHLPQALDGEVVDDRHKTMTTAGCSQSSW